MDFKCFIFIKETETFEPLNMANMLVTLIKNGHIVMDPYYNLFFKLN